MKALQKFVDQKNHWNSIFNGPQYEIATSAGRQKIADMIEKITTHTIFRINAG